MKVIAKVREFPVHAGSSQKVYWYDIRRNNDMSTESIIKVGGISKEFAIGTKELSIKKKGPHVAITGGEDYIEGAGSGITRDIKGL